MGRGCKGRKGRERCEGKTSDSSEGAQAQVPSSFATPLLAASQGASLATGYVLSTARCVSEEKRCL